jgi:hypothetical protein
VSLLMGGMLMMTGAGCDQASTATAPDEDRIIETLVDLHLLDGRIRETGTPSPALRDSVLARHGFTAASFGETMDFYVAEPEALVAIYSSVLDRLTQERLP